MTAWETKWNNLVLLGLVNWKGFGLLQLFVGL